MIWADYLIVAIVGASACFGIVRGFVREAFALCGWIVGVWLALTFGPAGAGLLEGHVAIPSLRYAIAGLVLLLSSLVAAALVAKLCRPLIQKIGLSGVDRLFGMFFGLARGAALVTLLVLSAYLTPLPEDPWWREAVLIPPFDRAADEIRRFLPPELAQLLLPGSPVAAES